MKSFPHPLVRPSRNKIQPRCHRSSALKEDQRFAIGLQKASEGLLFTMLNVMQFGFCSSGPALYPTQLSSLPILSRDFTRVISQTLSLVIVILEAEQPQVSVCTEGRNRASLSPQTQTTTEFFYTSGDHKKVIYSSGSPEVVHVSKCQFFSFRVGFILNAIDEFLPECQCGIKVFPEIGFISRCARFRNTI
jgi:hypothetical protein